MTVVFMINGAHSCQRSRNTMSIPTTAPENRSSFHLWSMRMKHKKNGDAKNGNAKNGDAKNGDKKGDKKKQ